jgi:hypothetical protein
MNIRVHLQVILGVSIAISGVFQIYFYHHHLVGQYLYHEEAAAEVDNEVWNSKVFPKQQQQTNQPIEKSVTKRVIPAGAGYRGPANPSPRKPKPTNPVKPRTPPEPKQSLLPKRVITIFGPESSGSTFLANTLGVAAGAFDANGQWVYTPPSKWTVKSKERNQQFRWTFQKAFPIRATSPNGWEIQHLSLPHNWFCEENEPIAIVEALVPEECWRYQVHSHLSPSSAERQFYSKIKTSDEGIVPVWSPQDETYRQLCQEEVHISELNIDNTTNSNEYTCGAKCGTGPYNGFALYPKRFSVNITSHIEWYLRRGVNITVVLSVRDHTMSAKSKLNDHCRLFSVCVKEDEVAVQLMSEAIERYGKRGGSEGDKARVVVASYEGLMRFGKDYLFDLYKEIG